MEHVPSPSERLSLGHVVTSLRERVAAWGARGVLDRLVMFLLYRRLGEIGQRAERMLARFQAGRLWRRGPRVVAVVRDACAEGLTRAASAAVLPRQFGWLVRAGGHEAAGLRAQLQHVMAQPEMAALLAASPQAVRLLRPLCRALAIGDDVLQPGRAPKPVVERKPRAKRVRKPREKIDFGRIPLPRGMLSAARRQGFGKLR